MKTKQIFYSIAVSLLFSSVSWVSAAPSLPITKAPVTPGQSYTGPTNTDSHAIMGQWFQSVAASNLEYRTHEFYDNAPTSGGGALGHLAIAGRVTNIVYSGIFPPYPIRSFEVVATIFNDGAAAPPGSWAPGTNSHAELLTTTQGYSNTLSAIIMTVDFASFDTPPGSIGSPPYRDSAPYITAVNHDVTSWYCWNSAINKDGAFYVPGWKFGTLLSGQSATQVLQFVMRDFFGSDTQMAYDDKRYALIVDSNDNGTDLFINRSTSLKISQWISDPSADNGEDYPLNLETNDASNVSVFHNTVEDDGQSIEIKNLNWSTNEPTHHLQSIGSIGIASQFLQVCTNLVATNWINVKTNLAWPRPQTNSWTNTHLSSPINFYRIVQP